MTLSEELRDEDELLVSADVAGPSTIPQPGKSVVGVFLRSWNARNARMALEVRRYCFTLRVIAFLLAVIGTGFVWAERPANAQTKRAVTHHVKNAQQVQSLIGSGKLSAGDSIVWTNGEYSNVTLKLDEANGKASAPIKLRAATPGGVILRGASRFHIGVQWWVIEGFQFAGQQGQFNSYNAVEFRGSNNVGAQHVRLTNCAFTNLVAEGSSSKWVQLFGRHNVIDHCSFSGKTSRGALITAELGNLGDNVTAEHRIAWNYFANFTSQEGTDNETIRIGSSEDQHKPAMCMVERNLFTRCSGENEIITNKASFNTFRSNTFRQCTGALVLRHGHHARVEGNYFFGDGADDAGGIRVSDSHHFIVNNYLQDLTGTTWNAAFSILGGKKVSGQPSSGYQAVDGIVVAHNSIINCKRSIFFNDEKGSHAPSGVMANNLVVSSYAPLVKENLSAEKMTWEGNILHGATVGATVEAIDSSPVLKELDGLLRPDPSGPVANAAANIHAAIVNDIDGQTRPKVGKDIGADEVAGAQGSISLRPLESVDVGVSFPLATVPHKKQMPKRPTERP